MNTSQKSALSLATLCALILGISIDLFAQNPPPVTPTSERTYTVRIGPENSLERAARVRGRVSFIAVPSEESRQKVIKVEFAVDGTLIGTSAQKPFRADYDTAAIRDGRHTVKAVGRDTEGKEVWGASTSIDVSNAGRGSESRERGLRDGSSARPPFDRPGVGVRERPRAAQPRRTGQPTPNQPSRERPA
ncbi:MAG: Ig-like domain-containing protein [Armatimonadota bacterium]|nr:Ig-like domain-containing protein [Armatimonadota bacterium]